MGKQSGLVGENFFCALAFAWYWHICEWACVGVFAANVVQCTYMYRQIGTCTKFPAKKEIELFFSCGYLFAGKDCLAFPPWFSWEEASLVKKRRRLLERYPHSALGLLFPLLLLLLLSRKTQVMARWEEQGGTAKNTFQQKRSWGFSVFWGTPCSR